MKSHRVAGRACQAWIRPPAGGPGDEAGYHRLKEQEFE
jgi:hypothetical protein